MRQGHPELEMNWPSFQVLLEHFGIAVAAVTGVLAARGKKIDLFGVLVLALVTAFGGGTVRDLLVGDVPVFWLKNHSYLLNALLTALVVFFAARRWQFPWQALQVADAFALALFTMVGVRKGLYMDFPPAAAVLLGVVTGVAGGILRDVLTGEVPLVFRAAVRLYATAALVGATIFVVLCRAGMTEDRSAQIGLLIVLILRLAGIRWRWTLPEFEEQKPGPPK
jgi:uncharacterized membrane protein YeiH